MAVLARLRKLSADRRASTLVEFALGAPLLVLMGSYGIELSNFVYVEVQVSQAALALADNASRIGVNSGQAVYQLREGDLNDVLQGARLMGTRLNITTYGRITLSSLENVQRSYPDHATDSASVQRLHWQRCIGMMSGYPASTSNSTPVYDSTYGQATPLATAGTDDNYAYRGPTVSGMGSSPTVSAPALSGVMFVEINYQYQPLFGSTYLGKKLIHSTASFVVRDKRDFTQIYNPSNALGSKATPSTCDLHNS